MARRFRAEVDTWLHGAEVTTTTPDKIHATAASRALNTAWLKAWPSKRKGCELLTQAAQTGKAAILGMGHLDTDAAEINWVIDDTGRWSKLDLDLGTLGAIDAANTTPFTAGTKYPSTTIANDYLFAVNGTDAKKTDGITVTNFGFAAPSVPTVVDAAVAGTPSGTYRFALTALNENSGHESSLSTYASVAVVNSRITVSWTFPSDTQITKVRVHIFKEGLSSEFFRLGSTNVTPAPDATTGGYASTTTSITVNVSDTNINDLVTLSPSTSENDPPPTGCTFVHYHGNRIFATDGVDLYYSKVEDPESFDPNNVEHVNSKDGVNIIGCATLADTQLLILKSTSSHLLNGPSDPHIWEIAALDPTIGAISFRSIINAEGSVWWQAQQGIMSIKPGGMPTRMDSPNVSDRLENLEIPQLAFTSAAYDEIRQRILFSVPEVGNTRNTLILPYNLKMGLWEDIWDPFDVSAMGVFADDEDEHFVALGGYKGRLFRLWIDPYVDGVRRANADGTVQFTLSGTVTSATGTTLTDSTATFDTDGDGLQEVIVIAVNAVGQIQRNRINSNTTTELTVENTWDSTPDSTWTYVIGSPNFEFDTKHFHPSSATVDGDGSVFNERNWKRVLIKGLTDTGQSTLDVYALKDGDTFDLSTHVEVPIFSGGAVWDTDTWDVGKFGFNKVSTTHRSLGVHARTCGLRIVNREPGNGAVVVSVGLYGTELGHKE